MKAGTASWVGRTLAAGRYQVTGKLGEGGMAHVYRAHDRNLDTDVVIKVPRQAVLDDPDFAGRFAREIRSLVKLVHPHIVKVIDVGEHDGFPFAVMQYLSGGNLRDRQLSEKADQPVLLPLEALGDWLEDVATALDFIHGQGYVHRDVKPDNILFDADGNAYLSDFGVAKVLAEPGDRKQKTVLGLVLGTPQYMAPELVLGQRYDGRADQYALGVMIYESASGQCPFDGATPTSIFLQHAKDEPRPLESVCPSVPQQLALAVRRALAKQPAERYPDCVTFARAVLASLSDTAALSHFSTPKMKARCPMCEKTLAVPVSARGRRVRCPLCGEAFQAPGGAQPAPRSLARAASETGRARRPSPSARSVAVDAPSALRLRSHTVRGNTRRAGLLAAGVVGLVILAFALTFIILRNRGASNSNLDEVVGRATETGPVGETASAPDPGPVKEASPGRAPSVGTPQSSSHDRGQSSSPVLTPRGDDPVGEVRCFTGHSGYVYCVAFSRDGRHVLSGSGSQAAPGKPLPSNDFTVRLWEVSTGKEVRCFSGHKGIVRAVAFSPDGRYILSAGDNTIRIWDRDNGKELRQHVLQLEPRDLDGAAFSPDGARLLISAGKAMQLLDTLTGKELHRFAPYSDWITCVAFSPDGTRAYSGGTLRGVRGHHIIQVWDSMTYRELRFFQGDLQYVVSFAISPDNRHLLAGTYYAKAILLDVDRSQELHRFPGASVCLLPDGRRALTGSGGGTMELWDVTEMRHLHVFHGHNSLVMGLAYSPDHRYVLSGSWDGTLRLWRLPDADLDGQSNTGSPSVETTTYTFKGNDSLRDLIAPDKYHRVRPTSGGLEILPLRFDRKTGWHPKGGHGHIQTKATFVIPTVVDFEVYSLKDANFDVTLGLFHKVLLRWGIYGNTRTFVEIAGEKIEVPHMRIVPDRLYHVTIAIDVNRTLDIKIDGKTLLERKLPSNLDLRGPVVLLGGGYGHFIHQAVKVKGKRLN